MSTSIIPLHGPGWPECSDSLGNSAWTPSSQESISESSLPSGELVSTSGPSPSDPGTWILGVSIAAVGGYYLLRLLNALLL